MTVFIDKKYKDQVQLARENRNRRSERKNKSFSEVRCQVLPISEGGVSSFSHVGTFNAQAADLSKRRPKCLSPGTESSPKFHLQKFMLTNKPETLSLTKGSVVWFLYGFPCHFHASFGMVCVVGWRRCGEHQVLCRK